MAWLAIKGHETRDNEVIEILKMFGNEDTHTSLMGNDVTQIYYIGTLNIIVSTPYVNCSTLFDVFTVEEFLEKYPFKVGDKVHIPEYESEVSICKMRWDPHPFCRHVEYLVYRNDEEVWYSAQELKEYNADFLIDKENGEMVDNITPTHLDEKGEKKSLLTSLIEHFKTTPKDELEREWNEHKQLDEICPTVEEYIAFAECFKKQPQYPKTYCECCDILGYKASYDLNNITTHDCVYDYKLQMLYRVLICRDAYWKIAGDWKPNWLDTNTQKYCIYYVGNEIKKQPMLEVHHFLAFPTQEMRDAFFENFKDLIEACKELL